MPETSHTAFDSKKRSTKTGDTQKKPLTKVQMAKTILRKKLKVEQRVLFDDEGNAVQVWNIRRFYLQGMPFG